MDKETVLKALASSLCGAGSYPKTDQVAPAAVLWTDGDRQWEPLLPRLREEGETLGLPILTLGPFDLAARTGPAIWLRCMVGRTLPEANWPEDVIPVIYLPGVSRQDLRAVEECPPALQPLAELQYRGVLWTQRNGKDWTIGAFLQTADGGLGIQVSADSATREALRFSLLALADQPVDALRKDPPLAAPRLRIIMNPDESGAVLQWINDPDGYREQADASQWAAFRATCKERFQFDPEKDGPITAAGKLGERDNAWDLAWNRLGEAPQLYRGVLARLRQARPPGFAGLFGQPSSWPQDNEEAESRLRERLAGLGTAPPAAARKAIRELEKEHGCRRVWIWAAVDQAPLAGALRHLSDLAESSETPSGGDTPTAMAASYAGGGWKADAAALDALASVKENADVEAVKAAVKSLYQAWLLDGAEAFQKAVQLHPLPIIPAAPPGDARCILFADGLRFDVGQQLARVLTERGLKVNVEWQFSALPPVTATAKPAVSPIADHLTAGPGFDPAAGLDGARVTVDVLRRELVQAGCAVLLGDDTGSPPGLAWTEFGSLDSYGHSQGWKLVRRVGEEVRELAERVRALVDAGWPEVRIVTDHGWLLLPGGLPKADLPEHLTEERKGRCARLKDSAVLDHQVVPWRWDPAVRIAMAPGISCYVAGREYEHGGLSVQECVVPVLTVRPAAQTGPLVTITAVKWNRQRCQVTISGSQPGLKADLRTNAANPHSSLAHEVKEVSGQGKVSLVVPDENRAGDAVIVVVLDSSGQVLAQRSTAVGEE